MSETSPAEEIFFAALEQPNPAERAAYLNEACVGQPELRARIEKLLAAYPKVGAFLESGAVDGETATFKPDEPDATATRRPASEADGTVIAGKYKLLQQIGEGGMGTVWMAEQTEPVKRKVAVKLIRVEKGQSKTILSRFEAEQQAIALMDHPHIAKLLDAGTTDAGAPFFVMDLVQGVPLDEFCDDYKLGIPQRLNLFMQICSAVQHAHQKGIIHRDLKPGNILVESHDGKPVPKVIDFGLAKATSGLQLTEHTLFTAFGSVMGTPLYMAPEQATFNAVDVDTRADVYALGVILYELLTGTTPLTRETVKKAALEEMLKLIREQEAPTPSSRLSSSDSAPSVAANRQMEPAKLSRFVKGELDWIVMKALAKERDRRYETANGFAKDVERFLNHEPVTAGPPTAAYRCRKFVRRNRGHVIAASLVLLALVAGVIGTTIGLVRANRATEAERIAKNDAVKQKTLAEQAAEFERQAKVREAEQAEGARKAKREAEAKRKEAEQNLAFAKTGNKILGSVFAGLDPSKIAESGRPLQDMLRENLTKAVKELEGSAIGDPLEVAEMQNTLGLSLTGLGEPTLAVEVFEKALVTRKARLGPDHRDTHVIMNNLAVAYQESGQLARALPLYEELLAKRKALLGPDDPNTLLTMNNLAVAYQMNGQFTKSLPLLEETLASRKARFGLDNRDALNVMSNLAEGYRNTGQVTKAVPLFEETLAQSKARLGPDHPVTLTLMNNLAAAYSGSGQLTKALPLLEEALPKQKTKLGPDHPSTLTLMNNLAEGYQNSGQIAKALPLYEEALPKMKARLGPDHPSTLTLMNNLARAYDASGQRAWALPLYEEALAKTKAKLGSDHPLTLLSMNNLAAAYRASGQLARALPLLEEAARGVVRLKFLDKNAAFIVLNAIRAYEDAGQYDRADGWWRKALALIKERDGTESLTYAAGLAQWGFNLLQRRSWTEAEAVLRESLAIRMKRIPGVWLTFDTQSLLGEAMLGQKKYAAAEPLLLKGYQGMKQCEKTIPPQGDTRIPEALERLIELYTATNRPDEAKKWGGERAKYPNVAPMPREKK